MTIDPARTALLVMDMQPSFLAQCADADGLIGRINRLADTAREAGAPIVFVRVGFRPGFPELPAGHPLAALARALDLRVGNDAATGVDPRLHRTSADIVVTKHRTSALHGNDLDLMLRSRGVDTPVLPGFSTAGVVLSTMDTAFDNDDRIVVPADCCADPDPGLHETLERKLFPRKATVLTAAELSWGTTT